MEYVKLWTLLKDPNNDVEILTGDEISSRQASQAENKIRTHYDEGDTIEDLATLQKSLSLQHKPKEGMIYTTKGITG